MLALKVAYITAIILAPPMATLVALVVVALAIMLLPGGLIRAQMAFLAHNANNSKFRLQQNHAPGLSRGVIKIFYIFSMSLISFSTAKSVLSKDSCSFFITLFSAILKTLW